jgi:hypothetical protein
MDLHKGFLQLRLSEASQELLAAVTLDVQTFDGSVRRE